MVVLQLVNVSLCFTGFGFLIYADCKSLGALTFVWLPALCIGCLVVQVDRISTPFIANQEAPLLV